MGPYAAQRMPCTNRVRAFCALLAAFPPSVALAQPSAPTSTPVESEPFKMERFVVTGSNLRRAEDEKSLPVTVIDLEDLDLRSAPTGAELADYLTQAGMVNLGESNSLGADARGDMSAVDLRGAGSGNTLVLLNGRRLPPHPISMSEGGVPALSVNVNSLPTAALSRVEVLRDGASAIYGADASAGVVNFLTRHARDRYELRLHAGVTEHGGANDYRATFAAGERFNQGKTYVMTVLDHYHRDALWRTDRDFSSNSDVRKSRSLPAPWNGQPITDSAGTVVRDNDFDNTESSSVYGNYVRGFFDASGAFSGSRPTGNNGISTSTTPSATATMSSAGVFYLTPLAAGGTGFRQTSPSRNIDSVETDYFYDFNRYRALLPSSSRTGIVGGLDHQIRKDLSFFGDVVAYLSNSETGREPPSLDASTDPGLYVPSTNPYNPFGTRFYHPTGAANADGTPRLVGTPADVLIQVSTGVRPREFRPREIEVNSRMFRTIGGLRGRVRDNFEWETALMYGQAFTRDEERNSIRESRLREALARTDSTAFNPFGYTFRVDKAANKILLGQPYTNADSVVDPLYDTFVREGRTELATWDAKINGDLLEIWGGSIAVAAGTEFRYENYRDFRPPYAGLNPADATNSYLRAGDNDFVAISPNVNLYSERNVISGFAEVGVPLVGAKNRLPLVWSADLSIAGRVERFSDFGSTTRPKASLGWRPVRWMMLRGSYNESFRAPNLVQMNPTPLQRTASGLSDDYRATVTNLLLDSSSTRNVFYQGNENLKPEESEAISLGFAVDVPRIKGLSFTFDYWRIERSNVIDNLSASEQLNRDEVLLLAETQRQLAAGKSIATIDLGSGTSGYAGNPKVTRHAVTDADRATFAAYNASRPAAEQRAVVGSVKSVVDDYINLAFRDFEGYDLGAEYRFPETFLGHFTLRSEVTRWLKRKEVAESGAAEESLLEENGRPKWRANASLSWRRKAWSAGWFTSYFGSFVDTSAATTEAVWAALGYPSYIRSYNNDGLIRYYYKVDPWIVHNANVSYRFDQKAKWPWLRQVTLRFGITNVLDTDPPIADETAGYMLGTANPRGRMFNLDLTKRF